MTITHLTPAQADTFRRRIPSPRMEPVTRPELESLHGRLLHETAHAEHESQIGDAHHREVFRAFAAYYRAQAAAIAHELWGE